MAELTLVAASSSEASAKCASLSSKAVVLSAVEGA